MTGVSKPTAIHKSLRPSQILSSEKKVQSVIRVFEKEYINPFGVDLDAKKLVNLSSGISVDENKAEKILSISNIGKSSADTFRKDRLIEKKIPFHDPIKKNQTVTFNDSVKSVIVKKGTMEVNLRVNRNIIGALLSYSAKSGILPWKFFINFVFAL